MEMQGQRGCRHLFGWLRRSIKMQVYWWNTLFRSHRWQQGRTLCKKSHGQALSNSGGIPRLWGNRRHSWQLCRHHLGSQGQASRFWGRNRRHMDTRMCVRSLQSGGTQRAYAVEKELAFRRINDKNERGIQGIFRRPFVYCRTYQRSGFQNVLFGLWELSQSGFPQGKRKRQGKNQTPVQGFSARFDLQARSKRQRSFVQHYGAKLAGAKRIYWRRLELSFGRSPQ